jgi:hypothetical protein
MDTLIQLPLCAGQSASSCFTHAGVNPDQEMGQRCLLPKACLFFNIKLKLKINLDVAPPHALFSD